MPFFEKLDFSRGFTGAVQKNAPPIWSIVDLINEIDDFGFKKVTELGGEEINCRIQKSCGCGWKKRSIFWDLPYWKTNLIRHNLDVMHIEKKILIIFLIR